MKNFVKKVYVSKSVSPDSRVKPPERWRDKVKEFLCERATTRGRGLDQARKECLDRERLRLFCLGHLLWERF